MKLFTKAGSTANIGVVLYRTNFRSEKHKQTLRYLKYIFTGLLLGELLVVISGMDYSWLLFAVMGILLAVAYGIVILKSLLKRQHILMAFSPKRDTGSFMISPNQILWVSPMGDIPVFDHRGYKVHQNETSSGFRFVCIGETGTVMRHEMQRLMPEEKIWKCKKLIFEFGSQVDQYPEAVKILETTQRERKRYAKAVKE